MSFNVSNLSNTESSLTKTKNTDTVKKNHDEIKLFSNTKVATDINAISSKYNSADFDDEREFAELENYLDKFKDYLSSGVQRFLNSIINRTTTYTAEQIQEMASHTDKATADRAEQFAQTFDTIEPGTIYILEALKDCKDIEDIRTKYTPAEIVTMASHINAYTASRAASAVELFSNTIDPGTLNILFELSKTDE